MRSTQLKLIGLTGPAGCGKDTIARFLCDTQEFRQIALADPIRDGIEAMFGISREFLTDRDLKETSLKQIFGFDKSPRQLMQTLGTEWGRNMIDPNIWLNIARTKIEFNKRLCAANNLYLRGIAVSDIRFEGEAKWLRDQGGTIWHIRRPNNPYTITTAHASEGQITIPPPIPGIGEEPLIINGGDIDQLHDQIAELLQCEEPAGSFTGDCV